MNRLVSPPRTQMPPAGETSVGFLLSPQEASRVLDSPTRWTMRTSVSHDALEVFRRHQSSAAIVSEGIEFPSLSFWVIAYQAAGRQHRAFLPLLGASVRNLLHAAPGEGLVLFLEAPDGAGLAANIEVPVDQAAAFLSAHREQCPELVNEVSAAASILRRADGLRPPPGASQPRKLYLSFILPPELVAAS
jgi:hypothetical protein